VALVEVGADWCPTCHQLAREVFEQSADRLPADRFVSGGIDFDGDEGQAVAVRYRVMGLPTTLLLDPDGSELGRIEGYETVDQYLAELRQILDGADLSAELLERFALAPDNPPLLVEVGHLRLAQGQEEEGLRLLERARALDPENAAAAWSDATRTLGRWFYRVRHDYERALGYYREGATRTAGTDAAWGFHWWVALALDALGRSDEAQAGLDALIAAQPGLAEPPALKAEFLLMTGGDAAAALALAREATRLAPDDDWNHYLVAVLADRQGDAAAATAAARKAVELAPGKAIYEHLLERLTRPPAAP
jgi:tetratricopeptide (TPR) repeat protein